MGAVEVRISGTQHLTTTYYFAGGQRIAMREGVTVTYLHGDHLGSASLATNASGAKVSDMRYTPFGEVRYGDAPTDRKFTGQREEAGIELYDYGARYYSNDLGRFVQADSIVPNPGDPQSLNRYSYTLNNLLKYVDPTGHFSDKAIQDYLTELYGEGRGFLWYEAWASDKLWMDLLHTARAGDFLSRITLDPEARSVSVEHFIFRGIGNTKLAGIDTINSIGSEASLGARRLTHLYTGSDLEGFTSSHLEGNGDIRILNSTTGVSASVHKVTEADLRVIRAGIWLVELGISAINPVVGMGVGAAEQIFAPLAESPGNVEGDNELMINLFVDYSESATIIDGPNGSYQATFRQGQYLSDYSNFQWITARCHLAYCGE